MGKEIINRGIGSDTAEGLYNRVDQITRLQPDVVFIMIGINDVELGIPASDTIDYVKKTCETISDSNGETTIYLLSVLPICTTDTKKMRQIQEINKLYSEFAEDRIRSNTLIYIRDILILKVL